LRRLLPARRVRRSGGATKKRLPRVLSCRQSSRSVQRPPSRIRTVWESDLGDWEEHPAFSRAPRRSVKDEADMTSMVDVTFLLLVFFMITASFSVTKALQTQPPSAEEGAASAASSPMTMDELAEESVVVEIGADDSITVDDVPVAGPVELGEILAAKIGNEGKTEMVIEAEYRATHGMVVSVTDVGMQAGMQRVRRVSRAEQQ
jgi:biopolymer transport protein ExbD